ncbi:MAG: SpoIIE family protein phosphatase [Bdellovibrio sp.]|nr:SpoIIE family protein phosphatase [Bdellovibrio sp.]
MSTQHSKAHLREKNIPIQTVAQFTTRGKYSSQEDFVLMDRQKGILVLADGFGGPVAGAEAAKQSCEAVRSFLFKEAGDLEATLPFILRTYFSLAGNVLFNSLIHANRILKKFNKNKNINEKGGASVVAGFVDGDLLALANVGSCSAWLIRGGEKTELVIPRSFARLQDPFRPKLRAEFQAPMIALGMSEDLEPEIFEYKLKPKDWLILVSDGVPESVLSFIQTLQQKPFSESALTQVKDALNSSSPVDNATLCVVVF